VTTRTWTVEHLAGSATAFHERPVPDPARRALWWFEVERPAVVLGSTQRLDVVDANAAEHAGTEVARRRSGGGAVHLVPGAVTWVDLVLPAADPRWTNDVGRSFDWIGAVWARVLADLGVEGIDVHRGRLVDTEWSSLVCFAGLGPGEITVGGRKVVGISQRRTRAAARYQCAVLHRWRPDGLVDLLALDPGERERARTELADVAVGLDALTGEDRHRVGSADLVASIERQLASLR
jgi:lipoate---protein ligase